MNRRLILSALAVLFLPGPGFAQLARVRVPPQDAPKLLVAPFQRETRDSALSLLVADGIRNRLRSHHLERFNTLSREAVNHVLRESDYAVDVPLGSTDLRALASQMNARYVVEGTMVRRGRDSIMVIARLTERVGNNPQSVNIAVIEEAGRVASAVGTELANRLATGFRSFADVEECRRQLGLRNYARALQKANDALRDYESSAAAHLCIADVVQELGASVDSISAILSRAHEADTLNIVAMRRLAGRYEASGDTVRLLAMLRRLLAVDHRDVQLRQATAQLLIRRAELPAALDLINEGLATNPGSAELLSLKMVALGAGSSWDSAAAIGEILAGMDSSRVDSLFVWRMVNYERQAADTAGLMRWAEVATRRFPDQLDYLYLLGSLRLLRLDTAGALEASRALLERQPPPALAGRARFIVASVHSVRGQVDSAVANATLARQADSTLAPSLAGVYLRAGQRAFADSAWVKAAEYFAQARVGRTAVMAAYYQGVALFQQGRQLDTQSEAGRDCHVARQLAPIWDEAEQSVIAGVAQDRERANQILQAIAQFRERAEGLVRTYCR